MGRRPGGADQAVGSCWNPAGAGWLTGVVLEISNASLELWYSFLAGGIIVVAAVYELPHIHTHRQYWAFLVGAGVFSVRVLAIELVGK